MSDLLQMLPFNDETGQLVFAIIYCNERHIIDRVENRNFFEREPCPGQSFASIFSHTSSARITQIFTYLSTNAYLHPEKMDYTYSRFRTESIYLSGCREGSKYIFLMAPTELETVQETELLLQKAYQLEKTTDAQPGIFHYQTTPDVGLFEEVSKLNNELINARRELNRKNHRLRTLNEKLLHLNAEKDKLSTIIAHDLKNPFQAILGFTELLERNADTLSRESIKKYATQINTATRNTFKLLENLLEWYKIQMGKVQVSPEEIDLFNIIEQNITILKSNYELKNILIINHIHEKYAFADYYMIDTVIRNLLSNAIKFTPEDGKIEVKARTVRGNLVLEIKDNGIGISASRLQTLFKASENRSTPGTEGEAGTGFGLPLCMELVERNQGTLSVSSEENIGTTFSISLPCAKSTVTS